MSAEKPERQESDNPENPIGESRKWFKMWVHPWLSGTVRFTCDHRERSVWTDLLALAAQSRIGGVICAGIESNEMVGIPLLRIAGLVDVAEPDLLKILEKFEKQKRIRIQRDVGDRFILYIVNWKKNRCSCLRHVPGVSCFRLLAWPVPSKAK